MTTDLSFLGSFKKYLIYNFDSGTILLFIYLFIFVKIGYHDCTIKEDMGILKKIEECETSSNIKIWLGSGDLNPTYSLSYVFDSLSCLYIHRDGKIRIKKYIKILSKNLIISFYIGKQVLQLKKVIFFYYLLWIKNNILFFFIFYIIYNIFNHQFSFYLHYFKFYKSCIFVTIS